jgi:hypothetical protein
MNSLVDAKRHEEPIHRYCQLDEITEELFEEKEEE